MKLVLQRVESAKVTVDNNITSSIKKGLLIYVGISKNFNEEKLKYISEKVQKLRLWPDEHNKGFKKNIQEINGEILVVSQFTLHGKVKGNKPDFTDSMEYEKAKEIYEKFVNKLKGSNIKVETGIFGAKMKVESINDGPITLIVEK